MFQHRVPHVLAGDYAPRSAVTIFVKYLGIVLEAGKRATIPLPPSAVAPDVSDGGGWARSRRRLGRDQDLSWR